MGMYASNAGKSGGEYYTPQEVSELLTRLTLVGKTEVNKVYDPACGFGITTFKICENPWEGSRSTRILWARNQSYDIQSLPNQHVPSRY
jgi:hypothetical protein